MDETPLRALQPAERAILDRLLEADFMGRDEVREQVKNVLARTVDEDGSIKLVTTGGPPAPVRFLAPVSGQALDEDGVGMEILLRMEGDRVHECQAPSESPRFAPSKVPAVLA